MGLCEYVEKVEHGIKELEEENSKLRDHINRLKKHNEGLISAIHNVGYDIGYDVPTDKYFLKASTHTTNYLLKSNDYAMASTWESLCESFSAYPYVTKSIEISPTEYGMSKTIEVLINTIKLMDKKWNTSTVGFYDRINDISNEKYDAIHRLEKIKKICLEEDENA